MKGLISWKRRFAIGTLSGARQKEQPSPIGLEQTIRRRLTAAALLMATTLPLPSHAMTESVPPLDTYMLYVATSCTGCLNGKGLPYYQAQCPGGLTYLTSAITQGSPAWFCGVTHPPGMPFSFAWEIISNGPGLCPYAAPAYAFNSATGMCERTIPDPLTCTYPNVINSNGQCVLPPPALTCIPPAVSNGVSCVCNPPNATNPANGQCESPEQFTLSLDQSSATLEPSGTAAQNVKTSQVFVATVSGNKSGAKAGAVVTIRADVTQGTGGHAHTDINRPKGFLYSPQTANTCDSTQPAACITGTTDINGHFTFTFIAPQPSGSHAIAATCDVCGNSPVPATIEVGVSGLGQIPISPFYKLQLPNRDFNHPKTHFLTATASKKLETMAILYTLKTLYKKKAVKADFVINDASLEFGGILDCFLTCANSIPWQPDHIEHRRGTVVDVKANGTAGSILYEKNFTFAVKQMKASYGGKPHGKGSGRHYHIRINGKAE